MRWWLVLAVIGCDPGQAPVESKPAEVPKRPPPPAPPAPPAIDAAPVVPPPVAGAGEPAPRSTAPRVLTKGWLDRPAWPAGGDELELAWLVSEELVPRKSDPQMLEAPLELIATIGGVSRRAILALQFGDLKPHNQALCGGAYKLEKGEVAKITFYEGGAGGYFVRRKGSDVLEVGSWEQGDGAGEVRKEAVVLRMHVPGKLKIREAIFEVDAHGARHPLDCSK